MKKIQIAKVIGTVMLSSLLVIPTMSGCALIKRITTPKSKSGVSRGLVEIPNVKHYQASDIPVPANFAHQPDKSYTFITGSVRTTAAKYVGSARVDELLEFYRKQMPQFGWVEKMMLSVDSKKALSFQKEKEKCEIIIEHPEGMKGETHLLIKIGFYK
jgi:hypothetical protein